jgi:hypothetical protein
VAAVIVVLGGGKVFVVSFVCAFMFSSGGSYRIVMCNLFLDPLGVLKD